MANYAVDDWVSEALSLADALAALETQLETYDTAKTIRGSGVEKVGSDTFRAWLVIDA